jgi:hypothetical protein
MFRSRSIRWGISRQILTPFDVSLWAVTGGQNKTVKSSEADRVLNQEQVAELAADLWYAGQSNQRRCLAGRAVNKRSFSIIDGAMC